MQSAAHDLGGVLWIWWPCSDDRFVKAWKDGTQRMGIFKGAEAAGPDDPNSASQVVRRHLSATSPSPLYQ